MEERPAMTRTRPPSLQACTGCRKQHVRCSGIKPVCTRCVDKKLPCVWIDSRRGYRDFRINKPETKEKKKPRSKRNVRLQGEFASKIDPSFAEEVYVLDDGVVAGQAYTFTEIFQPILDNSSDVMATLAPSTVTPSSLASESGQHNTPENGHHQTVPPHSTSGDGPKSYFEASAELMETYYNYYHPAHPFIAPQKLVQKYPSLLPDGLRAAVRFMASHYVSQPTKPIPEQNMAAILSDQIPEDGFKVQALLIYCMGLFLDCEPTLGALALENAIRIALNLGMNREAFALNCAPYDPTQQEMWRRTWWTLFIFDCIITAIGGQKEIFRLKSVLCDVSLPGEDLDYAELKSSATPASLSAFADRVITEDQTVYSSFAYCIEATQIMGSIFMLGSDPSVFTDLQVEAIDSAISNFFLALPAAKREVVEVDNKVDEPLLIAHMLINWASILLHRPRSTLTFIRDHYDTVCTKREVASRPALAYVSHTSKTVRAADAIMRLASIQRPLSFCSPSLLCGITTAAVVHLPAYAIAEDRSQAMAIKERLQLAISALGRLSEMWSRAGMAKSQIAAFAREVLTRSDISVDSSGMGMPVVITQDEMPNYGWPTENGAFAYGVQDLLYVEGSQTSGQQHSDGPMPTGPSYNGARHASYDPSD